MNLSGQLFNYYDTLQPPAVLPSGIHWLYPQQQEKVMEVLKTFLYKYYNDLGERRLLLGINPGRLGAGVTGVNFTAPKQLTHNCGIAHDFKMQSEISADFIYTMIDAYGGVDKFYNKYFIASVCPLGFIKNGRNIDYYDYPELLKAVEPFIINSLQSLAALPIDRLVCYCLGEGKNYKYLQGLNSTYKWFDKIVALPHPRFIMQYQRRQLLLYIKKYLDAFNNN